MTNRNRGARLARQTLLGLTITFGAALAGALAAALAAILAPAPAPAQQDGDPVAIGAYRVIESRALGETRRLLVHLPRGYEGSAVAYPVLYHTYGSNVAAYYAEAVAALESLADEASAPQMILVGIDNIDRYRDLRPLNQDGTPAGIENYTRFLVEEVFPFVEANYRTARYRILAGPQAGAVFGLATLQGHPELFDAFVLNNPFGSPPNTALLLEQAAAFYAADGPLRKFCYVTHGEAAEPPAAAAALARLVELAASARARGFELRLHDLAGNGAFVPPLPLREGLRALFAGARVPRDAPLGGLAEIEAFYARQSERYGYDMAPPEFVMTLAADALLQRKEPARAIQILERQTALYPGLLNGWWRLAGVAAERGDAARAIELYRHCVALDPSVRNFVERRIAALEAAAAK